MGLSYRATNLDELIEINARIPLHPLTLRLLNILSADDLVTFAQSRRSFESEYRALITNAFLRQIALSEDEKAATLVPDLIAIWPQRRDLLERVWARNGTPGYRLSMLALALPEPRVFIRLLEDEPTTDEAIFWDSARRTRDLPLNYRSGGGLNHDYGLWLRTIQVHEVYYSRLHSRMISTATNQNAANRASRRAAVPFLTQTLHTGDGYTPLPQHTRSSYSNQGIAEFAAWDELSRLGPETGLANRIDREIIANARRRTSSPIQRLFSDQTAIADELELVIWQGRRMIHGELDDKPLGQVAFEVLHDRLGRTDAAERNPYWYICQGNCVQ